MNERQEQTADVLGKLTVLGTIVLPLNIICGMWGMNVKVPGQDVDSLTWFYSSMERTPSSPRYMSLRTSLILPFRSHRRPCYLRVHIVLHCKTGVQHCLDIIMYWRFIFFSTTIVYSHLLLHNVAFSFALFQFLMFGSWQRISAER